MGTKVGVADFGVGFVIPLGIPSNLHDHLPLWQFDRNVLHSWNVLNVSPADVSLKHSLPTYPLLGMSPRFKTHPASSDIYVSTAFNAVPIVFVLFCAVWSNCHNRVHWRRRNGCGHVETAICVINTVLFFIKKRAKWICGWYWTRQIRQSQLGTSGEIIRIVNASHRTCSKNFYASMTGSPVKGGAFFI